MEKLKAEKIEIENQLKNENKNMKNINSKLNEELNNIQTDSEKLKQV